MINTSKLLILFFMLAVLGGIGLFYLEYQLPDQDIVDRDVNERLLKIDSLDSSISELALRNRANIDTNYDMLVRNMGMLDRAVDELESTYFSQSEMKNSLLENRFLGFKSELEIKRDLIENFKSHNSVLRNSEKYTPIVGAKLIAVAQQNELTNISELYNRVVIAVLEFTKQGSTTEIQEVKPFVSDITATEKAMPSDSVSQIIEFTNHVSKAIDAKTQADLYLNKALLTTSDSRIEDLSKAWGVWQVENNHAQEKFRIYMGLYVLSLLALISFIVYKLRQLYSSLDSEVAVRVEEVKTAYKKLQQSEKQLIQTEKMASLGQLVAGVAHEINTPLGYVSSNVDVLKLSLKKIGDVFNVIDKLSDEISSGSKDKVKLSAFVKKIIMQHRELKEQNLLPKLNSLLDDSSYGVHEMSNLVTTLKDFSRIEDGDIVQADIHDGLESTIKMCSSVMGKRKIVKQFANDLPKIECMAAQLNQVFMNLLTNAAQATDPETGLITMSTSASESNVKIVFRDNGIGMDGNTLNHVFDPFFTTKETGQGVGLGMSISYKIIQNQRGKMFIESAVGKGTVVTIQLPVIATTVQHDHVSAK